MKKKSTRICDEYPADGVREAICDLVLQGRLNATDLKIIRARDCSPMPSFREVSKQLKIPLPTVHYKVERIKRLVIDTLPDDITP